MTRDVEHRLEAEAAYAEHPMSESDCERSIGRFVAAIMRECGSLDMWRSGDGVYHVRGASNKPACTWHHAKTLDDALSEAFARHVTKQSVGEA